MHAYSQVADSFGVMMPLEAWGHPPFDPEGQRNSVYQYIPHAVPSMLRKKVYLILSQIF